MDGRQALSRLFLFPPPPSLPRNPAQKWRLRKSENIRGWGKRRRERGRGGREEKVVSLFYSRHVFLLVRRRERGGKEEKYCASLFGKRGGAKGEEERRGEVLSNLLPRCIVVVERKRGERIAHVVPGRFIRLGDFFVGGDPRKKNFLRRKRNGV